MSIATPSYSLDVKNSAMTKTYYKKGVDYVEVVFLVDGVLPEYCFQISVVNVE